MHDLLVRTLHGATSNPIAQPQILVIAHAPGVLTVVADERLQALPHPQRASQETSRVSWRRIGRAHCGQTGAAPCTVATKASTLPCSAANICGRNSNSTSRSRTKKRGGSSAKTGRAGGVAGSGRGCGCGTASSSTAVVNLCGGMDGGADSGQALKARH